ncbi:helix-turn-helix domain-containing protein [Hymenobacter jejuensis]|uniref:Helix-turn-helix domain-containing protein n=1 Tax=Hymenobacter jejuensis TaxID=2502781 RepID=A0A5B7ZVH0_9BACT|nr:helix-turn-helix domain-containing protein [Hymenobacter jejuensis]QDA59008.1 helix-turn-helix domain-containing protein [Hymenobacter jejuensis]
MMLTLNPAELADLTNQIVAAVRHQLTAEAKQAAAVPAKNRLLKVAEAAERLQLAEKTVTKYLKDGTLRGRNLGTLEKPVWRVQELSVDEFIAGR